MSDYKYRILKLFKYPLQDFEIEPHPKKDKYEHISNKVFGHHDGLTSECVSSSLFELYVEQVKHKENEYLDYQSFVMFIDNEKEDEMFWKNTEEFNFLFVSFLHLPKYSLHEHVNKLKRYLKKTSMDNKDIHLRYYETLDNADLIVCISTNQFKHGVNFLKKMYFDCPIDYIYTFLSSNKERIKNWNDENEILHNVIIRYMINTDNKSEIDKFNTALKKYFEDNNIKISMKKPNFILGHDDISFIIPEIPAKVLMQLFAYGQLLDENNELYKKCVSSSDTRFGELIDTLHTDNNCEEHANSRHSLALFQKTKEFYSYLHDNEYDIDIASLNLLFHGLGEILKLMMKHEQSKGADYVYLTLYKPMEMLVDKISSHLKDRKLTRSNVKDVLTFLEDASFILTRSNDSSLQLFQLPISLNHLYEASGKLIAFYSAYMNEVKKILNTTTNEYAFLVSPLLKDMTEVQILFSEEIPASRLILVKVSTSDFYDSRKLLPILTHELSHFVGDKERCRNKRVQLAVKVLIASLIEYIFTSDILSMFHDEGIDEIREALTKNLYDNMKEKIEINVQEGGKKQEYQNAVSLIEQLYRDMSALLNDETLYTVFKNFKNKNLSKEEVDESYVYIQRFDLFKDQIINHWNNLLRENAHFYIIKKFVEMSRECYADLVMVKFLNLPICDYLDTFQFANQNGNAKGEEDMNGDLIIRLSAIVNYLHTQGYKDGPIDLEKEYIKNVYTFLNSPEDDLVKDQDNILIFEISCNYRYLLGYLNACGEELDVLMNEKKQEVQKIQELYKKIDTEEFPNIINYFNDALRNELMQGI